MQTARKILLSFLTILTGLVFLYSAYTKTDSLESFERFQYTVVEYVHLPWLAAILGSRLLVGMEAGLGTLILIHFFGKRKWVLMAALVLLAVFSVYLVYLWAAVGNNVNCGCFGDAVWMSPSSSLLKNAILIILIFCILKYHTGFQSQRSQWITWAVFLGFVITPFIVYPLPNTEPGWLNKGKYKINLTALYAPGKTDAPKEDLYKGKHVIAFFSLKCPHCKMAAYKMHVMKKKNPALPFYMVLGGNDKYLQEFWDKTSAQNIPYTRLAPNAFTAIAGFSWPAIYLVNNGVVEAETNYISMDQSQIEAWLGKP